MEDVHAQFHTLDYRPASSIPLWKQGLLVNAYDKIVSAEISPNIQVLHFTDNVVLLGHPKHVQKHVQRASALITTGLKGHCARAHLPPGHFLHQEWTLLEAS